MELENCTNIELLKEVAKRLNGQEAVTEFKQNIKQATQKKLFDAKCTICGEMTTVPFEPHAGYPVKCFKCFQKIKAGN